MNIKLLLCCLGLVLAVTADEQVTLIFGGDVMLSRMVDQSVRENGGGDSRWLTENIKEEFSKADIAFANLESPFLKGEKNDYSNWLRFSSDPVHVSAIANAGIDVVSLANNHCFDRGLQGLEDTLEVLAKVGIIASGAGATEAIARTPTYLKVKGVTIAILSYTSLMNRKQSVRPVNIIGDYQIVREEIEQAKKNADFVIVSMHAGPEYKLKPNGTQKKFSKMVIDAGADAVIGHHSHWAGEIIFYKQKPIVYSLGNLIFDQNWQYFTQRGLVVKLYLNGKNFDKLTVHPILIEQFRPRFMTPHESFDFLSLIHLKDSYSIDANSTIVSSLTKPIDEAAQAQGLNGTQYPENQIIPLVFGGTLVADPQLLTQGGKHTKLDSISNILKSGRITFVNLEIPDKNTVSNVKVMKLFPFIRRLGVDITPLPRNQCNQDEKMGITAYGPGLLSKLHKAGIQQCGGGMTTWEAQRPFQFEVDSLKIAYLCFTDKAKPDKYLFHPGSGALYSKVMKASIVEAKKGNNFVVVGLHFGGMHDKEVTQNQKKYAKIAIDAGADIVVGYHPSSSQRVETYKDRPILYSLGTLYNPNEGEKDGTIIKVDVQFRNGTVVGMALDSRTIGFSKTGAVEIVGRRVPSKRSDL